MKETDLIIEFVAKENPNETPVVKRLKNGDIKVVVELSPGKLEELLTSPMDDEE